MKIDKEDNRVEADIRDRIDFIFENYTLEEIIEMNDLTDRDVIYLLFMEGHINEPEAYFP